MRVVNISGLRGSGKTTLIRELIGRLAADGKRSAVIVNEEGEEAYDEAFLKRCNVPAEFLRGG
jgi:G3E family GTPase